MYVFVVLVIVKGLLLQSRVSSRQSREYVFCRPMGRMRNAKVRVIAGECDGQSQVARKGCRFTIIKMQRRLQGVDWAQEWGEGKYDEHCLRLNMRLEDASVEIV